MGVTASVVFAIPEYRFLTDMASLLSGALPLERLVSAGSLWAKRSPFQSSLELGNGT